MPFGLLTCSHTTSFAPNEINTMFAVIGLKSEENAAFHGTQTMITCPQKLRSRLILPTCLASQQVDSTYKTTGGGRKISLRCFHIALSLWAVHTFDNTNATQDYDLGVVRVRRLEKANRCMAAFDAADSI